MRKSTHPKRVRKNGLHLLVNDCVEKRGLEWMTRFVACVVIHNQQIRSIAINTKQSEPTIEALRHRLFDFAKINGETVYFTKPEIRKHLDLLEHHRREMFDKSRAIEDARRKAAGVESPADPLDALDLTPGNLERLKRIRRTLGAPSWTAFLTFIYDGITPPEIVADSFPEVLENAHDVVTWRRVLLSPPMSSAAPGEPESTPQIRKALR